MRTGRVTVVIDEVLRVVKAKPQGINDVVTSVFVGKRALAKSYRDAGGSTETRKGDVQRALSILARRKHAEHRGPRSGGLWRATPRGTKVAA